MSEICPTCKGKKEIECNCCDDYPCEFCEGTGSIPPGEEHKSTPCPKCNATCRRLCEKCENTGIMTCDDCLGSGEI